MKRNGTNYKKTAFLLFLAAMLTFAGCSATDQKNSSNSTINNTTREQETMETSRPSQSEAQEPVKHVDPVEEQIKGMTLEEKIGQMMIVGFEGYAVDEDVKMMIDNWHTGGFILFGRNIKNSNQLLSLINSLKKTNTANKVPLFISVDEEGGRISRMPADLKKLPAGKTIGEINRADFSYEIGSMLAEEIKSFGFNMNFAPVLDVNSNPRNPVIGDRSFGADAGTVSKLGVQTMKGIREGGVIPVVKHFPGHGDTSVDSHIGLPTVDNDMERLNRLELVPFKAAIENLADVVMVAHILMKKIDPEYPASMSRTIIMDILREQLNFSGVVITDDMTMGAVTKNYNLGEAAVKSVNAGCDIILVCHGTDNISLVVDSLKKAAEDGVITEERINESVYRILKLKYKYGLSDKTIDSIDIEKINNRIDKLLR